MYASTSSAERSEFPKSDKEFDERVKEYEDGKQWIPAGKDVCLESKKGNDCSICFKRKVEKRLVAQLEFQKKKLNYSGQLKLSKFTNFQTRLCKPRKDALETLVKYIMGRSGYQTLFYTVEEVVRARFLLLNFGYSVKDYIAWSRTWPIKTAAMPHAKPKGDQKRTMTRNSQQWDEAIDERVDQLVRDFFNEGGRKLKVQVSTKKLLELARNDPDLDGLENPHTHIELDHPNTEISPHLQQDHKVVVLAYMARQKGNNYCNFIVVSIYSSLLLSFLIIVFSIYNHIPLQGFKTNPKHKCILTVFKLFSFFFLFIFLLKLLGLKQDY